MLPESSSTQRTLAQQLPYINDPYIIDIVKVTEDRIAELEIELQQQNADLFFGEPSFDINDLMRTDSSTGQATINIIRVIDIQEKTKLFSRFMLSLLRRKLNY